MKAHGGFTLLELLLAGAILATISFGALVGTMRINQIVNDRSDLMAVDGFCWDVAWKLFNDDYESLNFHLGEARKNNCRSCEIKGEVLPMVGRSSGGRYEFLTHLQFKDSPPVCYITLSNACDAAGTVLSDEGICISVNLEWGPKDNRSILMPREGMDESKVRHVLDHPVCIYRSSFSRSQEQE